MSYTGRQPERNGAKDPRGRCGPGIYIGQTSASRLRGFLMSTNNITTFTSESVCAGHPDKICDQISDAILDVVLTQDRFGHVACETLVGFNKIVISGEITANAKVDFKKVAREQIKRLGYIDSIFNFSDKSPIDLHIHEQSQEIAVGVDHKGAGDQGMMFGYACNETPQLMPLPITLAHSLTKRMDYVREEKLVPYLRPDGKSQVTIEYKNGKPKKVLQVVIAIPHEESVKLNKVKEDIYNAVVVPVLDQYGFKINIKDLIVNGTGVWHHGGPAADCGVTGRKIVVDGYGGYARVGGGAFCLAGDSLVNTEKGLVRIDSCQEIGEKGLLVKTDIHPMPAAAWYDNGVKPTELIITKDGYQLEATLNHNIRVIDPSGNYVWRPIEHLQEDDWISIQTRNRLFGNDEIPAFNFRYKEGTAEGRKKKYKLPLKLTEDYSYLLGLLVGDGDCTDTGCIRICICEEEMQVIVQNLYERIVGDKGKIYGHWAYLGGVELRAFLEHLGLTNARSFEKVVPKSIFSASERNCAAFLRGLFDTDGSIRFDGRHKNTKRIHLATTSKKLAEQVQLLLLNFGVISKIQSNLVSGKESIIKGRKIKSKHIRYDLVLKGSRSVDIFTQKIGFNLSRKNRILAESVPIKRNLRTIPNQRERIRRLFKKLPLGIQRKERDKIGRFIRSSKGKATKELTYEKLKEFIHLYDDLLKEDADYIVLKELYYMEHYYSRLQRKIPSFAHTYDLNIPFSHTFTANGIVCHNSGKDPTKVDRSGAYAARFLAKNIVANKLAEKAEVRLAYFIGAIKPSMQDVETFGTAKKSHKVIQSFMEKILDTSVAGILSGLDLQRPIYLPTASYGHFGREEFPWERIV